MALEGEAGIGKTHLVRDVCGMARSAGVQVVEVVADEVTRRPGLVPHGLIDEHRIPAVQRDVLRELLHRSTAGGDPGDLSFAIVDASVDALESLARSEAAMLVVEDSEDFCPGAHGRSRARDAADRSAIAASETCPSTMTLHPSRSASSK